MIRKALIIVVILGLTVGLINSIGYTDEFEDYLDRAESLYSKGRYAEAFLELQKAQAFLIKIFIQPGVKEKVEISYGGKQIQPPKDIFIGQTLEQISVEFVDSSYAVASAKTSGFFKTGQKADLMLSGVDFNNAGGSLLFNHPGGIASDGTHLLLADRNNNRILIWNKLPEGNVAPDLVLGQKNFTSNDPGDGLDRLNWPVGVATDGKHVLVADTYNDRILIWNNFPTKNGQPADLVLASIGDLLESRGNIAWPWGIWTNGEKVVVTSTGAGQVLIWNKFPTVNKQQPDIVLWLKGKFGTPRSVGSDGTHLVIGDHNAFGGSPGNFFWRSFPVRDNEPYDFFIAEAIRMVEDTFPPPPPEEGVVPLTSTPFSKGSEEDTASLTLLTSSEVFWGPTFTPDGKLLVLGSQLYVWNSFPEDENDAPDLVVGEEGPEGQRYPDLVVGEEGPEGQGYHFEAGDGSGLAIVGDKLYLSLSNGNKIVSFNTLPARSDELPDFAVGSPDINTNTLETNFIISNPVPISDGKSLFVSSDFDRKLYIWKNLPDESGAKPDIVYTLPEAPWDNALFGQTLVLAGKRTIYVWKKLPLAGEMPALIFNNRIGNVNFQDLQGVTLDDKYFYLADNEANRIYVWEGIPTQNSNPKFSLTTDEPCRLSSDGEYLVVTATLSGPGGSIKIYPLKGLSSNSQPMIMGGPGKFNLPQGAIVSHGHLFVGDTGFNRVLIWNKIEDALAGKDADIILGAKKLRAKPDERRRPEIGMDKLFWPAIPAFDGSYLWVGEFKFSERLLRFSPQP